MKKMALGMVETYGYVGAVEAADACVKSANVELVGCEFIKGGLVTILIKGDVGAVKASIDAAEITVMKVGKLISTHIIPRPSNGISKILPKSDSIDEKLNEEEVGIHSNKDLECFENCENVRNSGFKENKMNEDNHKNEERKDNGEEKDNEEFNRTYNRANNPNIKTREELNEMKTVELRSMARELDDKYEVKFPIERSKIKYSRKKDLIEGILEYYERVK